MLQVAAQEGLYLAKCFNRMKICEENPEGPLRIRGSGRHRFKPFRLVFHACDMHLQREQLNSFFKLQNSVENIHGILLYLMYEVHK